MCPEYGATVGFFPVDRETLRYLEGTGRSPELIERVERISREQGLFRTDETPDAEYTSLLELDLGDGGAERRGSAAAARPRVAGRSPPLLRRGPPRAAAPGLLASGGRAGRGPDERTAETWSGEGGAAPVGAGEAAEEVATASATSAAPAGMGGAKHGVATQPRSERRRMVEVELDGRTHEIGDGSIVIAAITSCTNTSNPSVMIGAGLVAKKAVELGLEAKPWVKTSMAPGSKVVTDYLNASKLLPYLEALHFQVVGYGCTTCIGNSGPLPEPIAAAIEEDGLVVSSILSGNRNYEARIHPLVRANYLASPMLVVAFALAGRIDIDLYNEPLGHGKDGKPVFLADMWPTAQEIRDTVTDALDPAMFEERYGEVFEGDELWKALPLPEEGNPVRLGRRIDVHPEPALLPRDEPGRGRTEGHPGCPRARGAGPDRHDGPHLAGGRDSARRAGRTLPAGARRQAAGLQHLRRPPGQSRGHDAGDLRQRPHPQPPAGRQGRRLHDPLSQRRGRADLRRFDALPVGRDAPRRHRRSRVRRRQRPGTGRRRAPGCSACAP
jgi:hypothetical protein